MTEVLFYHLTQTPLERTLPDLLEKSLQRGWRVLVIGGNKERLDFLDTSLWSYRDDSFLPHGRDDGVFPEHQPILLSTKDTDINNANILMLVDGAAYTPDNLKQFERVCLLFDGNNEAAVADARIAWKATTEANLKAVYWSQETGPWVRKVEHTPQ